MRIGHPPRTADRDAADLLGRRHVTLQQHRREIAHRDVVEAVTGFVAGEHVADIDLQSEKIADRIAVFRPVEPAKGRGSPRIRPLRGEAVEPGCNSGDQEVVSRLVRPRQSRWRHLAAAQLSNNLLPPLPSIEISARRTDTRERKIQVRSRIASSVACHAVLVHKAPNGRLRDDGIQTLLSFARKRENEAENRERTDNEPFGELSREPRHAGASRLIVPPLPPRSYVTGRPKPPRNRLTASSPDCTPRVVNRTVPFFVMVSVARPRAALGNITQPDY